MSIKAELIQSTISRLDALIEGRYISHLSTDTLYFSILIMEKTGKAFARLYCYHDDLNTVYLDSLSVDDNERKSGIGTELQAIREKIGIYLGATESYLFVVKNTWMHEWYKRRGYKDFKAHEDENMVWMMKNLTVK